MIYFAQVGNNGPIKIGYSHRLSLKGRLKILQGQNKEKIKLLLKFAGTRALEQKIHKQFYCSHISKEWFNPSKSLLYFIRKQQIDENTSKSLKIYELN